MRQQLIWQNGRARLDRLGLGDQSVILLVQGLVGIGRDGFVLHFGLELGAAQIGRAHV